MKVCIWFGCIAVDYQPPGHQLLFVPTCRLWAYTDNDSGDGFTAVFVDLEDMKT